MNILGVIVTLALTVILVGYGLKTYATIKPVSEKQNKMLGAYIYVSISYIIVMTVIVAIVMYKFL